jgi:hypothetical protein
MAFMSCSDDKSMNNTDDPVNRDRPPIPEPTYYSGPVPLKSVEMEIETVPLSDYSPWITCAASANPAAGYVPDSLYCTAGTGADSLGIYSHRTLLLNSDTAVAAPIVGFFQGGNGNPWNWCTGKPLSNQPYLQLVRYWVRIGDVERYAGSTSKTTTRTTTRGTTETSASEFTKTLGIEASVSGSWFVDFEVKVKTEFSWSESHETSIMQEESYEESFTISSPENKNIVYCVWQLVEEYRIVGVDGGEFTDPNYDFDPDYESAACPTSELVPITTFFDN